MLREVKKTSYRAKPVPSINEYGVWGHFNRFGGFHGTTDPYAYIGLFWLLLKNLHKWGLVRWLWKHQIWYRWHHRMCDTMDFHHEIYCLRDPWVRQRDAEDRWTKIWTGK